MTTMICRRKINTGEKTKKQYPQNRKESIEGTTMI